MKIAKMVLRIIRKNTVNLAIQFLMQLILRPMVLIETTHKRER